MIVCWFHTTVGMWWLWWLFLMIFQTYRCKAVNNCHYLIDRRTWGLSGGTQVKYLSNSNFSWKSYSLIISLLYYWWNKETDKVATIRNLEKKSNKIWLSEHNIFLVYSIWKYSLKQIKWKCYDITKTDSKVEYNISISILCRKATQIC